MEIKAFGEIEKINSVLALHSEKEQHEYYTTHVEPDFYDRVSDTLFGGAAGALTGMVWGGPIGSIIGGTFASIAGFQKTREKHETHERIHRIPTYEIAPNDRHVVYELFTSIVNVWVNDLSTQDRLTAFFALFNGMALYCFPKEYCIQLIDLVKDNDERNMLSCFADFVFAQLESPDDSSSIIGDYLARYDGSRCPHVVSLYLMVEALSKYLPEERDDQAFEVIEHCYKRLPQEYRNFIMGSSNTPTINPAIHRFLLPQLEKSEYPIVASQRSTENLDYIGRQAFLHLRVAVYYSEGHHMSLNAKLMALLDSKKYVYQAAESVYSIQSILRDFAHTYGNMKASQLSMVSEKLFMASQKYEDPELRRLAQLVVLEAKIKHDLTTGIQLMHLRCREDAAQISERLFNSIANCDDGDTERCDSIESIEDIVDSSIKICLYRIFYDVTDRKAEIARKKMRLLSSNWSILCRDFEEKVVVEGIDCIEWLRHLSSPIIIQSSYSELWQSLRFYKGSFASVLLEDLLAEIIFNALKYSDFSEPITIDFWQDSDFIGIQMVNSLPTVVPRHNIGSGIQSRNETMSLLNGPGINSIETGVDSAGAFSTNIRLRQSLFFR